MFSDRERMLGKYQLVAEIARGGMGIVYLAMIQGPGGFNKLVVVKELKPEFVEEPAFLTMFLDEARLAARLSHPNIVQTNEVGNDGDRYFMAMDYLDGRGLDQVRRRTKGAGFGMSLSMHLRVICEMLSGLEYAHNLTDFDGSPLNIVHRDVSPQNVFITFDGQVKLLDFGIAKASDSMHQTHAGVIKGKVAYMSPEQGRGDKVDARADVFSAGVLLWEALTGRRLRDRKDSKNEPDKLWALVSAEVPRASSVKPSVPPELDRICAQAMAWDRNDRYPSAAAMQHDLERYLTATGTNVSAREVGGCISELFREDRATTNGVIEAYLARARAGAARDKLPVIDVASRLGAGSSTPSNERQSSRPLTEAGQQMTSLDVPSARLGAGGSAHARARGIVRPGKAGHIGWFLVSGIGLAALVGVILFFAGRSGQEAGLRVLDEAGSRPLVPLPHPDSPAPRSTAQASEPGPHAVIDVEIRVSPGTATIAIDGKEVGRSPFAGRYAMDDVAHSVRVAAPGYVTKSVSVAFNANVTLDLSLERLSSAPASPARPGAHAPPPVHTTPPARTRTSHTGELAHPLDSAPARPRADPAPASEPPPAAPATDVNPAGGHKPRRPIDPNNPYGARE